MEKFKELHAHLNGSISTNTMRKLFDLKNVDSELTLSKYENADRTLAECFEIFKIVQELTDSPEAVKMATRETLKEFNEDGVIYLELRSTPRDTPRMNKQQYVQAIVDAIQLYEESSPLKTCLLLSIDRRNSVETAEETVELAVEMNTKYPLIIVGIDVSGDPYKGNLSDFIPVLDKARKAGLKITIHNGEIINEKETIDILKWSPDRIGHMTILCDDVCSNEIWNILLQKKTPIELCLSSNLMTKSVSSYDDHHLKRLLVLNHPISLGTDDKGVFNTSLSKEYLICAETFKLRESHLYNISRESVKQSFADEETKLKLFEKLDSFKKKTIKDTN